MTGHLLFVTSAPIIVVFLLTVAVAVGDWKEADGEGARRKEKCERVAGAWLCDSILKVPTVGSHTILVTSPRCRTVGKIELFIASFDVCLSNQINTAPWLGFVL